MSRIYVLFALMTSVLVLGLVACSGDPGEAGSIATPISTSTLAPTPTSVPSVTPEPPTPTVTEPDLSARREDGSLGVTFRVLVPPETAPDSTILMTGDRPALGSGVDMKPVDNDPLLYEAEVVFGHDGTLNYQFELNGGEAVSSRIRVETAYDGQIVNDQIASWADTR